MKKIIILAMLAAAWGQTPAATTVRYDAPVEGRPIVATGVEMRGSYNGASYTTWNTASQSDGWVTLTSDGASANVLVLNDPAVVGGRLATNETWTAGRVWVVRDDVIVPSGKTLTLGFGAVIKFLPGSRFVVEAGGSLVACGASLADFADDSVGGDTNMDGGATAPDGTAWWLDDAATAALVTVDFLDGAAKGAASRSYTAGVPYGELPMLAKDGARFDGWWTAADGGSRVTAATATSAGVKALYAHWTPLSVAFEPSSTNIVTTAGDYEVAVIANDDWTVSTDAGWIALGTAAGSGDGSVSFSVSANASTDVRVGTIRATLASGGFRDFTVTQGAMGTLPTPTITPADGTTFSGSARRVTLSCSESGATIRYTLDGSEPTESSTAYAGRSFNVFDTTTVKARAFKDGMLASGTATARIIRLQTLAEAIDQSLWTVTTGNTYPWTVDLDVSRSGGSSARSGAIGAEEVTGMETTLDGAGALTFWWRASCEDDPDYDSWDYLALYVDGLDVKHIDGDSGWQKVTIKIKGNGTHTIRWEYRKDDIDGDDVGDDCGWVDQVAWSAEVGDSGVPVAWIENFGALSGVGGIDGTVAAIADSDPDGDGFTTAQEYVTGTDPDDPDSTFKASIEIVDGKPVVTYTPDLLGERNYTKWGKKTLSPDEDWVEVGEGEEENYNFFKVTVEMK